ncbi:MAG: hypothetical protein V5A68_00135, partial [Candidatus Thermoplasmatota archaeon]
LEVKVFIDGEKHGDAEYNTNSGYHEIKWTAPKLGTFNLEAVVTDSSNNSGQTEMKVWYFCFIP